VSAPVFRVEKISDDVTLDPAILLAGETLRYTITVKNIGSDNATMTALRDAVPVNTAYVAGSTTLNGIAQPDGPGGTSPLAQPTGMLISAPENLVAGVMRADASPSANNVATIRFDVVVDPAAIDGTVISNQGFVNASGVAAETPSDDPNTVLPNDPTLDVVGAAPLLFAPKTAALLVDGGTVGVVDPGDTLRYTITVYNTGAADATLATLQDAVPANTTWVADSLTLNGLPVGVPDGGVSPLAAGIPISSSDRTPPLPLVGEGVLTRGASAVVTFDLMVNGGTPPGTLITNQARVTTAELPNVLTDGDGNPATGPEPTVVVVGGGQQLSIAKLVTVVGGGAAMPGSQVEYTVFVRNIATTPATNVVLTDDLAAPVPGYKTLVAGSATLNGAVTGVTVVGDLITADYSTTYGPLAPGASVTLRFRATLGAALPMGTIVTNTGVVTWNVPPQQAMASVSITIGGTPGVGALAGSIWHDEDFDRTRDAGELDLSGWIVDLYRNGVPVLSAISDANGDYRMTGIAPNALNGDAYALRFRAPDAGANTAALGRTESPFTNGLQEITNLVIPAGSNLLGLSLPIDPGGVVYEAVLRTPISGATLTLLGAGTGSPVSASCFDDPQQQGQVTGSTGYYKFDLNFSDGSCPAGGGYLLAVTPPGTGFEPGISAIIPPQTRDTTAAFDVPSCPAGAADAIPGTAQHCEVQNDAQAPPPSILARTPGTDYHLHVTLDDSQPPGTSQLFNNHIPLDPVLGGAVAISKTTPKINVSKGDLVPYQITLNNSLPVPLADLSLQDDYPAGFRYIEGSARVTDELTGASVALEPTQNGRRLTWTDLGIGASSSRTVVMLLAVGAGVSEGEFVNRAQAFSSVTSLALSGQATATVRVVPDPTFDCTDVLGKVFDDTNHNGYQDQGEKGLPDVRVMSIEGLGVHTDPHGRFHITCAVVPNATRGSNFILKLDDRTLPSGYRMTTRQTQVLRATRGKALRFSFGASIHRVVGLDLADAVFEPGTSELRTQWKPSLEKLIAELEKSDSILRLTYVADIEPKKLVEDRLETIEKRIRDAWAAQDRPAIEIETEIYWRRGGPVKRPAGLDGDETSSLESSLPPVGAGPPDLDRLPAASGERILPSNGALTQWTVDPDSLQTQHSDKLEQREVLTPVVETVKLRDIIPAIRFDSGVADISPASVEKLRKTLDDMQHLDNVRLHLVGHADDQPPLERPRRPLRRQRGPLEGARRRGRRASPARPGAAAGVDLLRVGRRCPPDRVERFGRRPREESARRGRGLVRRHGAEARAPGGRRPRRDPPLQGLPHRTRLQAPLQGRTAAPGAGQEPDPTARVPERVDRAARDLRPPGRAGPREPRRQAERHGQVHRPHRRRAPRRPRRAHLRHAPRPLESPRPPRRPRPQGSPLTPDRGDRERRLRRRAPGRLERDARRPREEPPHRGRALARRPAARAARRAADLSGRGGRRERDPRLRSAVGRAREPADRARPARRPGRLCGEAAPCDAGRRERAQRAPPLRRLYPQRAPHAPPRGRLRRRHRPLGPPARGARSSRSSPRWASPPSRSSTKGAASSRPTTS
jgi:uncharacterized repeat protein (TIGR01451 family)